MEKTPTRKELIRGLPLLILGLLALMIMVFIVVIRYGENVGMSIMNIALIPFGIAFAIMTTDCILGLLASLIWPKQKIFGKVCISLFFFGISGGTLDDGGGGGFGIF